MKLVALEEHYLTQGVLDAWHALDLALQDPTIDLFGTDELNRRLMDFGEERLSQMDAAGIDVSVLSLNTPATQNLEPEDAVRLARDCNDLVARAVAASPDRLQGFATLPTPDPEAAARELERAVLDLKFRGAMIAGRTRDRNVDDPSFEPLYATAARLRAPLYIHPAIPVPAVRDAYYSGFGDRTDGAFATLGWGWHIETGLQAVRLILSGVFDRHPELTIILGHWGEGLLFYLERIAALGSFRTALQRPIADYVRDNVYVTPSGMLSERYLRWSIEVIGVDRIMFSTDYPYQIAPGNGARAFVEQAALSDRDRDAIGSGNWQALCARIAEKSS